MNENTVPDECELIGDLDGNGEVNVVDLLLLLAAWAPCSDPCPPYCLGDLNNDCTVDALDQVAVIIQWGEPGEACEP